MTYNAVDHRWKTLFHFGFGMHNNDLLLDSYERYYKEHNVKHLYRKSTVIKRNKFDLVFSLAGLIIPFFSLLFWLGLGWSLTRGFELLMINIAPLFSSMFTGF